MKEPAGPPSRDACSLSALLTSLSPCCLSKQISAAPVTCPNNSLHVTSPPVQPHMNSRP